MEYKRSETITVALADGSVLQPSVPRLHYCILRIHLSKYIYRYHSGGAAAVDSHGCCIIRLSTVETRIVVASHELTGAGIASIVTVLAKSGVEATFAGLQTSLK